MPIMRMHREGTVPGCAGVALLRESRGTASSERNGWVARAGLSNELLGGFTDCAECGSATSATQMSSSISLAGLLAHLLAIRWTILLDVLKVPRFLSQLPANHAIKAAA